MSKLQIENDYNFLKAQLEESDLKKYFSREFAHIMQEYNELARETEPGLADIAYEYFALRKTVRMDFNTDFISFFKFISDARQVKPIFTTINDFHRYGFDVLSDSEKHAGNFTWNEGATVELTMIPRGVGKSVYLIALAAWELTLDRFQKSIITHGKKEFSASNIALLSTFIVSKPLNLIYKDIFQSTIQEYRATGSTLNNGAVNIKPPNFYFLNPENDLTGQFRKEDSYSASSPLTSDVGKHVSRIYFDDLVNWDSSATPAQTLKLIAYFRSLFALKEHSLDGTNNFKARGVGTEYYEESLYNYIRTNMKSSVFALPIDWIHEGKKHYIVPSFTEKYVQEWKDELNEDAESQLYMIPRKFNNVEFNINFDKDRHTMQLTDSELDGFKETMIDIQVCDFAYSDTGKQIGDGKSRFTILHILRSEDVIYIYDCYSSFSEKNESARRLNLDHAISHRTDIFIADANGTQANLAEEIFDILHRKYDMETTCIPHKTSKVSGSTNKLAIANTTLGQYFLSDIIKVIVTEENRDRIQLVIDQLRGADKGLDVIDCLVYSVIDVNRTNIETELFKARAKYRPNQQFLNLKKIKNQTSFMKRGRR